MSRSQQAVKITGWKKKRMRGNPISEEYLVRGVGVRNGGGVFRRENWPERFLGTEETRNGFIGIISLDARIYTSCAPFGGIIKLHGDPLIRNVSTDYLQITLKLRFHKREREREIVSRFHEMEILSKNNIYRSINSWPRYRPSRNLQSLMRGWN